MVEKIRMGEFTSNSALPFMIHIFVMKLGSFRQHTHNYSELIIILEGTGLHIVNGKKYNVTSGDVFVLKKGDEHCFENATTLKICNIMYYDNIMIYPKDDLKNIPGYLHLFHLSKNNTYSDYNSTIHLKAEDLREIEAIAYRLNQEYAKKKLGYISIIKTYFKLLIILISCNYHKNKNSKSITNHSLVNAISFIEENFTKVLTLKEISSKANMSTSNFTKVFKTKMLCSPLNYVISCRLKKACDLLSKTDFSITEISSSVGFDDCSYFARQFKKRFSVSPLQFRKIHSNDQ